MIVYNMQSPTNQNAKIQTTGAASLQSAIISGFRVYLVPTFWLSNVGRKTWTVIFEGLGVGHQEDAGIMCRE